METSDARFDDTMQRINAWLDVENILLQFKVSPALAGFVFEIGFRNLAEAKRFRRWLKRARGLRLATQPIFTR